MRALRRPSAPNPSAGKWDAERIIESVTQVSRKEDEAFGND